MAVIADFTSLKQGLIDYADVADTVGDNISDDRLSDFVQFATHSFNYGISSEKLRVREMETIATLTPSSGVCTLPTDYLQYRRVALTTSRRQELAYIAPSVADQIYPDRGSGVSQKFTIIGSSLYLFPLSSTDVELTYYQAVPHLTDAAPTNWLLTKHPQLYLHACLFQLAIYRRDPELKADSAAMMQALMSALHGTDEMANYAYAPTNMRGMVVA